MNTLTIALAVLAVIVMMAAVIYVLVQKIKKLKKRNKELESAYCQAERNVAYLVKHAQELSQIQAEETATLNEIAGAKTDDEIYEIVNSIVDANNNKL